MTTTRVVHCDGCGLLLSDKPDEQVKSWHFQGSTSFPITHGNHRGGSSMAFVAWDFCEACWHRAIEAVRVIGKPSHDSFSERSQ